MEVLGRRRGSLELKYNDTREMDNMLFFKGMRDYTLFDCKKWEDLLLGVFRNRLGNEVMQRENWGNGELLSRCYRRKEFSL